ncbi:MAG: T9SS type A sorting domain-containing protein [bacterium]
MKKVFIILFLLLSIPMLLTAALTRAPEDFLGRTSIPYGTEVDVLKFKTDLVVFAGTNGSGLYISYDAGSNWAKLTGFPEEFPCIKDIIIVQGKDIYVATYGGGIYFSKDNGSTFTPKNNGLTNLYTQALAITNDGMLICGTYGSGVFYSRDNGANWVRTDRGLRYDNINCIQVMKNGRIVAGSYGGGFYVSRDTCKTWLLSNTQLSNLFINDLSQDLTGKLYAATNGAGVMFSGDGMQWLPYSTKWHKDYDGFTQPLMDTAATSSGANAFQILMGTRSAGMYYWDDLWNAWQNSGDLSAGITSCAVSPNGTILATRSFGDVIRSTDNGLKWVICADQIIDIPLESNNLSPTFLNVFVGDFDNSLVSVVDSGTKQRLYQSKDHGNSWQYLNSITTSDVFDVEITPDGTIFVADDAGIHKYSTTTGTFDVVCDNSAEPNSFYKFQEIEYNPVSKSLFATYELFEPADPGPPPPDPPYKRLEYRLYKSINNGQSWTFTNYLKSPLTTLNCETNGDIYLKIGANFSQSTDGGATFNTLETTPQKMIYGKEGYLYYWNTLNEIYVKKKKVGTWSQIPFTPQISVAGATWVIQSLGSNVDGDLYVSIRMQLPSLGYMYELYMTSDTGTTWQTMKGCYNMDKIRTITADNNGYSYFLTNSLYKVINPSHLKPPTTLEPADNMMGAEIHPVFKWRKAPLAEEYVIELDPTDNWDATFEVNVTGDTTCTIFTDLAFNQQYYWRIRSKTHSALSNWTAGSFTIGLEPPILISPIKGKLGIPLKADLKWHKLFDATHYTIQVAEDENFDKIVYEKLNHPDTTLTTDKLTGLKVYYWRVKAFTSNNASRWSEVWNFRTVLGPPQLIYPANLSNDRLPTEQFYWCNADEAQTYYLQVSKDDVFTDLFFDGNIGADTFKLIDNMLPETDYYWHVASVNADGKSDYSVTWTFRTSLKPVELFSPDDGKVNVPLDTKFTWMEHNGGSQYQIQISKVADFKTTVVDQKVTNVLEFQTNKLEYYKDYFWRVRLVVGTRVGLWSDIRIFKTGIESASLLNPPDKSINQPTTLKFKWSEIVGVKYYQLQISKNEAFTDLVYSTDSLDKAEQYVEDLEPEIKYFWRVRAWNEESYGTSQWSNVWTFTTGKVTLVLRNPKTGSTGVSIPTLVLWFPATTADYYHLQVAKDAAFANVVFDKDSINETQYTLSKTDVEISTSYFWHVKGVSKQYTTDWSDTWQFTTGDVSVKESELFSSITLYPNPTGSKAELYINYAETCDAKILITTTEGKIIKTDAIRLLIGETRYEIDTEHLTSGSYYITIITPSGYVTRELVVVK